MSWVAIAVGGIVGTTAGGISSAVKGEPVWKGMLIGAGTGLAGGALGAGLGALGGAASGSAGGAAGGVTGGTTGGVTGGTTGGVTGGTTGGVTGGTTGGVTGGTTGGVTGGTTGGVTGGTTGGVTGGGGSAVVNPTVQAALTQSPTAITNTPIGTAANAPTIGIGGGAPGSSAPVTSTAESGLTSMIDKATPALKSAAPGAVLDMAKGFTGGTTFTGDAGEEQQAKEAQGSQWAADTYQQPSGSWLPGKAKGGAIHLRDGDFIVPADVVSAIGNGSTKAGAKYLNHLFTAISAGPAPKAGSLAKQRAKARHAA